MHLTGNKIVDELRKFLRTSPQHNSKIVTNEKKMLDFIKKHLNKNMYLQKEDKKLLMI